MNLLKMFGPEIRGFFTNRPILSKQLNSLTTIIAFSWLGGSEVTHPILVREVSGSIYVSCKSLYVWFSFFWLLYFYFLCPKTHFVTMFCNFEAAVFSCRLCFLRAFPFISLIFIYNINWFSILSILQDLLPIIRV